MWWQQSGKARLQCYLRARQASGASAHLRLLQVWCLPYPRECQQALTLQPRKFTVNVLEKTICTAFFMPVGLAKLRLPCVRQDGERKQAKSGTGSCTETGEECGEWKHAIKKAPKNYTCRLLSLITEAYMRKARARRGKTALQPTHVYFRPDQNAKRGNGQKVLPSSSSWSFSLPSEALTQAQKSCRSGS